MPQHDEFLLASWRARLGGDGASFAEGAGGARAASLASSGGGQGSGRGEDELLRDASRLACVSESMPRGCDGGTRPAAVARQPSAATRKRIGGHAGRRRLRGHGGTSGRREEPGRKAQEESTRRVRVSYAPRRRTSSWTAAREDDERRSRSCHRSGEKSRRKNVQANENVTDGIATNQTSAGSNEAQERNCTYQSTKARTHMHRAQTHVQ